MCVIGDVCLACRVLLRIMLRIGSLMCERQRLTGGIVKAAQETNTHMWQLCPTCNQVWTGQMALGLARARAGAVLLASSWPDSLPEDDEDLNSDRLQASRKLAQFCRT